MVHGLRPRRPQHLADLGRIGDVDRRGAGAVDGDNVVAVAPEIGDQVAPDEAAAPGDRGPHASDRYRSTNLGAMCGQLYCSTRRQPRATSWRRARRRAPPDRRVGQAVDVGGVDEHGGVTERLGQRAAGATTGTPAPIASRASPKPS